jgi:hypothetical protein
VSAKAALKARRQEAHRARARERQQRIDQQAAAQRLCERRERIAAGEVPFGSVDLEALTRAAAQKNATAVTTA